MLGAGRPRQQDACPRDPCRDASECLAPHFVVEVKKCTRNLPGENRRFRISEEKVVGRVDDPFRVRVDPKSFRAHLKNVLTQ